MPEFQPDVEALLQRFTIQKPAETFQVGPVTPDPATSPAPINKTSFADPTQPLTQQLQLEAAKVQDIIGILKDTAPQIRVPVPPEDQPFLGKTISTSDYINSLESPTDLSPRTQQHFEAGVLSQTGDTPHWTVLMLGDLVEVRNSLISARDMIEGKLLSVPLQGVVTSGGVDNWKTSLLNSDLSTVNTQLILGSAKLRFKVAQTVFTLNASLKGSMFEKLLTATISPEVAKIQTSIRTLLGFLRQVRAIFSHSQLLLAFEHLNTRDALLNIGESVVIEKMLNILVVKLSEVLTHFAAPVLEALENGLGSGPMVNLVTEDIDHQLVSMIGGTCQAIVTEYKQQVAGFIRDQGKKNTLQLNKLQSLGERSLVGRWMLHLDQMITLLEKVLVAPSLSRALAAKAVNAALQPPAAPHLPVLQQFLAHPELQQAESLALRARTFGITPQVDGPPVVPLTGNDTPLPDPLPQFGGQDINPYPKF